MVQSRNRVQQLRGGEEVRKGVLASDLAVPLDLQHHNTAQAHQFGGAFDIPTTVSDTIGGSAQGTPGSSDLVARADHVHGVSLGNTRQSVTLTGTIPATGSVTLGTIVIAAAPYDRIALISCMMLPGGVNTASYQLGYTAPDGTVLFARCTGGLLTTATLLDRASLVAAGANPTLTFTGSCAAGATAASVTNDARFNRADVLLLPA
jgi:hypothetical protein